MIDQIFFAYPIIADYLTGYEMHQLCKTSRVVNGDINNAKVWDVILSRDYPYVMEFRVRNSNKVNVSLKRTLLCLEYGTVCEPCVCDIDKELWCAQNITKNEAMEHFRLSSNELDSLPRGEYIHQRYKTPVYYFAVETVREMSYKKYGGAVNFKRRMEYLSKRAEERNRQREIKRRNIERWYSDVEVSELIVDGDCMVKRQALLDAELESYGIVRRADSDLARSYIEGGFMSLKIAAAYLYMTHILFLYGYKAYRENHQEFKRMIIDRLYSLRKQPMTTEVCKKVVDDIHRKIGKRLENYRIGGTRVSLTPSSQGESSRET